MIKLLKDLKWSPNGCIVETISAGDYQDDELPERAIEIASQLGFIGALDGESGNQNAGQQPEQQPEKKGKK